MDNTLPDLPSSDPKMLERNKESRDFWAGNKITRIEDTEMKKCKHNFLTAPGGVKCTVCNFGLLGQLEVQNGSLFYKGEKIEL